MLPEGLNVKQMSPNEVTVWKRGGAYVSDSPAPRDGAVKTEAGSVSAPAAGSRPDLPWPSEVDRARSAPNGTAVPPAFEATAALRL